jgi:SAM-dependent methyltransferase
LRTDEYKTFFDLEDRHFWFRAMRSIVFHQARQYVGAEARVLDVGCGTGGTMTLMPPGWRRVGVDFASEAISFARSRGERDLARATAERLPFESECFDSVFALDVIEHCDDDAAAIAEVARVLRPGGTLILTTPAFMFLWSEHDQVVHHRRRYRRAALHQLITNAGFSVKRLTYFNALLFAPIAAVRFAKRVLPYKGEPRSDNVLPPAPINEALTAVFGLERRLIDHVDLPVGVSLLAVASR